MKTLRPRRYTRGIVIGNYCVSFYWPHQCTRWFWHHSNISGRHAWRFCGIDFYPI
jgi:hypothetical protein